MLTTNINNYKKINKTVRMINTLFIIFTHLLLFELFQRNYEINKVNLFVILIHFEILSFIKLNKTKFTI